MFPQYYMDSDLGSMFRRKMVKKFMEIRKSSLTLTLMLSFSTNVIRAYAL